MPRTVKGDRFFVHVGKLTNYRHQSLVTKLTEELQSERQSGQPVIEEIVFPTGLRRVSVLWDLWHGISLEERSFIITTAYKLTEPSEDASKVRLASGLTYPEAVNSGMLPYQILLAHRPGDQVTIEQCHQAMIEEGASLLIDPNNPLLLFGSEEQATAARERLILRLPGSENVWLVNNIIGASLDLSWSTEFEEA